MQLIDYRHLSGDLIRGQNIIGIQPLNVVSMAQGEGFVSGCGSALVGLRGNADAMRFEAPGNGQRFIGGTIVHDDDFLASPRRDIEGAKVLDNQSLTINRRKKIEYKRFHAGSPPTNAA